MYGAWGFDTSALSGHTFLNLDSGEEGVLTVGCAGGAKVDVILPLAFQRNENPCVAIALTGLLGGHSGIMINQGRQNADKMLGAFLASLPSFELVSISGGFKDNVIPNAAECVIATSLSVDEISAHAADFVRRTGLDTIPVSRFV